MRGLTLTLMLLLMLVTASYAQEQPEVEVLKLGIIHTNDTHGHLLPYRANSEDGWSGVARRRVAIQRARADTDYYWLVLDAGDVFQGTPISNLLTGFLDFECMNQMGYDAMSLGNHEFDFGYELLRGRITDANFHVLSANIIDRERGQPVAEPYCILRRGDYRIGIIGLTTETLLTETHPSIGKSVGARPATPVCKSLAGYLRSIGCDVVIALAHQGYNRDMNMAGAVPELDVIVGGHTHTFLDEPDVSGTWCHPGRPVWENFGAGSRPSVRPTIPKRVSRWSTCRMSTCRSIRRSRRTTAWWRSSGITSSASRRRWARWSAAPSTTSRSTTCAWRRTRWRTSSATRCAGPRRATWCCSTAAISARRWRRAR
jgi:hypothetical protein